MNKDFILGTANGMSRFNDKIRVVVEGAEFADYFWPAMEQLVDSTHDYWRSNGQFAPGTEIQGSVNSLDDVNVGNGIWIQGGIIAEGDVITFCSDYFEENWIKPGKLIEKRSSMARTSLTEIIETEDDSSIMSDKYSKNMLTTIVVDRTFIMPFSQPISSISKIGDKVDSDTVIYIMSDPDEEGMSEKDRELFGNISNLSPKAEFKGEIITVDVLYNGNIDDMCDSLKKLTKESNLRRAALYKEGESEWFDGAVSDGYLTDGKLLRDSQVEITFNIAVEIEASSGDKVIIGNQGKSVSCDARTYRVWTEKNGEDIELSYSSSGFIRRNIMSAKLIGSTNSICILIFSF